MRELRADEVEVRIGQIKKNPKGKVFDQTTGACEGKASFLLYKNARVDMTVLDEEFGVGNWQRDHKEIKNNLYCGIGVRASAIDPKLPTDDWVWKWDCGTESYTEKEKGESSDSFKRAGFCWGIGRELYTAPQITLPCAVVPDGKKWKLANPFEFWGLYVRKLEYMELDSKRVISKVVIYQKASGRDAEVYRWGE